MSNNIKTRFLLAILSVSLLACTSTSQNKTTKSETVQSSQISSSPITEQTQKTPSSTELLIATPPANWKLIYELNKGDTRLSDFIPGDEQKGSWQTKLSFEAHAKLVEIDPIEIMMGEISKKNDICSIIYIF